jgi:ABC-type branched-subunit amino acid transport system ATPase component
LLVDEPSLGVAQALVPPIMQILRTRADAGATIIVVEQLVNLVVPFADQVLVLDRGAIAYSASTLSPEYDSNRVHALLMGEAYEGDTHGIPS